MSLEQMAGKKSGEIVVGGETLKWQPLTVNELAEFEHYARAERMKYIFEVVKDIEDRKALIRELDSIDFNINEFAKTLTGIKYLLWLAVKRDNQITLEEFGSLITLDNIDELTEVIENILPGGGTPEKKSNQNRGKQSPGK